MPEYLLEPAGMMRKADVQRLQHHEARERYISVHILVTLCRFDRNTGPSLKQDHLFLPREGWPKRKSGNSRS